MTATANWYIGSTILTRDGTSPWMGWSRLNWHAW